MNISVYNAYVNTLIWCDKIFDYDEQWPSQTGSVGDEAIIAMNIVIWDGEKSTAEQKISDRLRWQLSSN